MTKGRAENGSDSKLDGFGECHVSCEIGGEGGQDGESCGYVGFVSLEHTVFIKRRTGEP